MKYVLISILTVLIILVCWWTATEFLNLISQSVFPGPIKVAKTFFMKMRDPNPDGATLPVHILASLKLALTGYAMGIVIGVPMGLLMGWYKTLDRIIRPVFDLIRPIPGIAWIPILIILFGIGLLSKAIVIFLTSFVACVENSYSGIQETKNVHEWVGRTFGASKHKLFFKIGIPTSLPLVFTGLRVALAGSWSALVAAELLASNRGLGFMIQQSRGLYRPDVIIVGMLSVGIIGVILNAIFAKIEKKLLKGR